MQATAYIYVSNILVSLHLLIGGTQISRLQDISRWNDRVQITPRLFDPWVAGWHVSLQSSYSYWAGKNPQKKFKSRASALGGMLDWDSVNCHMSPSMANCTIHSSTVSAGKQTDVFIERDISTNSSSTTIKVSTRKKKNEPAYHRLPFVLVGAEFSYWQDEKEKEGLHFKSVLHNSLERMSFLSQRRVKQNGLEITIFCYNWALVSLSIAVCCTLSRWRCPIFKLSFKNLMISFTICITVCINQVLSLSTSSPNPLICRGGRGGTRQGRFCSAMQISQRRIPPGLT